MGFAFCLLTYMAAHSSDSLTVFLLMAKSKGYMHSKHLTDLSGEVPLYIVHRPYKNTQPPLFLQVFANYSLFCSEAALVKGLVAFAFSLKLLTQALGGNQIISETTIHIFSPNISYGDDILCVLRWIAYRQIHKKCPLTVP